MTLGQDSTLPKSFKKRIRRWSKEMLYREKSNIDLNYTGKEWGTRKSRNASLDELLFKVLRKFQGE